MKHGIVIDLNSGHSKITMEAICMKCGLTCHCFNIPDIGWVCPSCFDYEAERNDEDLTPRMEES